MGEKSRRRSHHSADLELASTDLSWKRSVIGWHHPEPLRFCLVYSSSGRPSTLATQSRVRWLGSCSVVKMDERLPLVIEELGAEELEEEARG